MGGPGRAQDLNYLIPGPELNNLNNLNIGGGGGGPGRAQDLNYLNYLIPGPELNNLNNLNNLNIGGGGVRGGPGWGVREGPRI